jgi:hypothetical protein
VNDYGGTVRRHCKRAVGLLGENLVSVPLCSQQTRFWLTRTRSQVTVIGTWRLISWARLVTWLLLQLYLRFLRLRLLPCDLCYQRHQFPLVAMVTWTLHNATFVYTSYFTSFLPPHTLQSTHSCVGRFCKIRNLNKLLYLPLRFFVKCHFTLQSDCSFKSPVYMWKWKRLKILGWQNRKHRCFSVRLCLYPKPNHPTCLKLHLLPFCRRNTFFFACKHTTWRSRVEKYNFLFWQF